MRKVLQGGVEKVPFDDLSRIVEQSDYDVTMQDRASAVQVSIPPVIPIEETP